MKQVCRKLALSAVSILLTALLLEILIRVTGMVAPYGYPPGLFASDPDTGYRYAANFPAAPFVKQEFATRVFTNSDGFRDTERTRGKSDHKRYLVVGDSFVWAAYGVDLEGAFTMLAEKQLSELSQEPCEVVNAGVVGWGTDNALAFLQANWDRYQPDGVVLSFCIANDFFDNLRTGEYMVKDGYLVESDSARADGPIRKLRNFTVKHSRLAVLVERGLYELDFLKPILKKQESIRFHGKDQMRALYNINEPEQAALRGKTFDLLKAMKALCDVHGVPLALLPIPTKVQVPYMGPADEEVEAGVELSQQQLYSPQSAIEGMCEELGIDYFETLEALKTASQDAPVFWELNPHFNAYGNQVVADVLTQSLYTQFLKGSESPEE